MSGLEPVINVLTLLTVLSITAERLTNVLKLQNEKLREKKSRNSKQELDRHRSIQARNLAMGIFLALIVKADMFSIVAHLDNPWTTLGWVRVSGAQWFQTAALGDIGTVIYAIVGCLITGVALGFGSKFWHDTLGAIYELRSIGRNRAGGEISASPVREGNDNG